MCYIKTFVLFCVLCCIFCDEGEPCLDEDGKNGTCVNINNCLAVPSLIRLKKRPVLCSFEGETPIICCSDCNTVNHTSNIILDKSLGYYFKTGQKAYDKCLEYMVNLPYPCSLYRGLKRYWHQQKQCYSYAAKPPFATAGGVSARRHEYPHMALLGYGDVVNNLQWLCGGSVISEKHILTAAHCISSPSEGPVTYVALGILKRTDEPELWQKYRVQKITPHPEYKAPAKYNDIALLETATPILFSREVLPACLNTGNGFDYTAWATGWGALGYRQQLADNLQTVFLMRFSEEECATHYPPHRHLIHGYDHSKQMCYGDTKNPRDTCEGDSGGPLQGLTEFSNCQYLILGVTSYGRACGFTGGSGMYTRVSYYVPWIESIVWP